MGLLGNEFRFEQGGWYSNYTRYQFFSERASWVASLSSGPIGVAGCGWGFLVDELLNLACDAYGFDASEYCVSNTVRVSGRVVPRIVKADALIDAQMGMFHSLVMETKSPIPLMVTEDMLPMLNDSEVAVALKTMNSVSAQMCHVVTCARPATPGSDVILEGDVDNRDPEINWKTLAGWKAMVGATNLVLDAETGSVI